MADDETSRGGVGSVETAFKLLEFVAQSRRAVRVSEVARAFSISSGKVHRYFVSLVRAGALAQQPVSGKYELGPAALNIGLSALSQVDVVRFTSESLPELRDATDLTTLLAVWGDFGPVVIRVDENSDRTAMNVRVGSVMSILTSAIGRVFLAFLPEGQTHTLVAAERTRLGYASVPDPEEIRAQVRSVGHSRIVSYGLPDISIVAVPIFDSQGILAATVAVLGPRSAGAMQEGGLGDTEIMAFAEGISRKLGYRGSHFAATAASAASASS